ncbi:respiratory nitrate reductase subunit gamma [Streptomyces sp. NPDC096032]|uniref:respiratory nitrate reductase subunit gamma n=1 Tax=Streptomyces sp. NPDC096032 TaxID=3366070 RepID=UPI00381D51F0
MALIAFVPYSRPVHKFGAPVQYLFRPYVVYRARHPRQLGRRGWERQGGQGPFPGGRGQTSQEAAHAGGPARPGHRARRPSGGRPGGRAGGRGARVRPALGG